MANLEILEQQDHLDHQVKVEILEVKVLRVTAEYPDLMELKVQLDPRDHKVSRDHKGRRVRLVRLELQVILELLDLQVLRDLQDHKDHKVHRVFKATRVLLE